MAVVSLELNELNFDFVEKFIASGKLPNFANLLDKFQLFETISEKGYPHLEPWIQWPTVYTGKTYEEHKIFRLGDSVTKPQAQIWENLSALGCKVGAISPMNASNRCKDIDFFLPDPWTNTEITAPPRIRKLYELIRQAVNDNASSDLSSFSLGRQILPLALPYLRGSSLSRHLRILTVALRNKWAKSAFLDSLLADVFLGLMEENGSQFGSLFLNAGAHIQHHHLFDSLVYDGNRRNPNWYSSAREKKLDPLLLIYETYDRLIGQFLAIEGNRLLITTGLSQIPNEREHYQYRINDFDLFFSGVGLKGVDVSPRMSRDFLLEFPNTDEAQKAIEVLSTISCENEPLFNVEDRGDSLFCQVSHFGPPEGLGTISVDNQYRDYRDMFTLVSIENGVHQTLGYHIDSGVSKEGGRIQIPLAEVYERLFDAAIEGMGVGEKTHPELRRLG